MADRSQRVRDIGEFELIARLALALPPDARQAPNVGLGIGDDAATWTPEPGTTVVVTTDALVEHVHFRIDWTDWASLGHKAMAVNVSDIAAMGARPRLATVVLGLTGRELVDDLESLYRGIGELAAAHGIVVVGGDVVRVPHDITLGVTLLGEVAAGQAMTRAGAQAGDLVVVSGTLGASAAGLALLERQMDAGATGPLLIAAHLRPNPRVALGALLFKHGATAAMDLSDGLLGDLPKILAASNASARIDVDKVPVLPAVHALFPDEADTFALSGGEDYELLLTVPETRFDRLQTAADVVGATLTAVGQVTAIKNGPAVALYRNGSPVVPARGAFDHFGA